MGQCVPVVVCCVVASVRSPGGCVQPNRYPGLGVRCLGWARRVAPLWALARVVALQAWLHCRWSCGAVGVAGVGTPFVCLRAVVLCTAPVCSAACLWPVGVVVVVVSGSVPGPPFVRQDLSVLRRDQVGHWERRCARAFLRVLPSWWCCKWCLCVPLAAGKYAPVLCGVGCGGGCGGGCGDCCGLLQVVSNALGSQNALRGQWHWHQN